MFDKTRERVRDATSKVTEGVESLSSSVRKTLLVAVIALAVALISLLIPRRVEKVANGEA